MGYYVLKYGGGRYTSVAWYPLKTQAEAEARRIKLLGAWSGMPPKIEHDQQNPSAMHVASLLFDKRVFTAAQAKAWAHAHGYRYGTLEAGGPAAQYWHLPQQFSGRVKRIVPFGSRYSGIRAIVARNPQPVCRKCGLRHPPYTCREGGRRNPGDPRVAVGVGPARLYKYRYYPGALDLVDPHVVVGTRLQPGAYVRLLAKRPAGGRTIRGWSKTFAWVQDQHGSEQIVFRRALHKAR